MSSESGWFDAFRPNGGPPLYLDPNRTSSRIDSTIFFILLTFTTAEIAFLLVLPGIRKEKISTFIIVSLSLFVGCTITVAHCGSSWHVAEASISSPYRAFSKQKIFADVGVYIGLQSVNITLKAKATHHKKADEINYNERFYWIEATGMKQEYQNALAKGLPFPILTILEYLSKADEGFCWGEKYRGAGSLSSNLLVMAFCAWIFMWILLCAVPKYGIYALTGLGAFMLFINLCYSLSLPPNPLRIPFPGGVLGFTYGWSYWLTMGAGVTALSIGLIIIIFDYFFPNRFSTIMEVDYDTPYRYFVGNDAHLFGGLANNGTHSHNNPNHHHHHQIASITNSASTESTCCGNNTLRNGVIKSSSVSASSSTSLSLSSSSTKSPVSKQKSDASVCTTESYPVTLSSKNGHFNNTSSNSVSNTTTTTTTTTRAIIEKQGQDNEAFDDENDDKLKTISDDKSVRKKNRVHPSSSSSTSTSIASTSSSGITSSSNNSSDPNEISTELVHGKRAVSLTNFGRFTARQHQLSLSKSQNCTKINTKLPNTHL